jgi:NADPH:quinone reductase-like Zn-dependent oxidoreductase
MSSTMRALVTKGNKVAAVENVPVPEPEEGEILVKVHYVAQVCLYG